MIAFADGPDITVDQYRFVSTNLGASWSETSLGHQGVRMGGYTRVGGANRIVEAWDKPYADAPQDRLRFRRQL